MARPPRLRHPPAEEEEGPAEQGEEEIHVRLVEFYISSRRLLHEEAELFADRIWKCDPNITHSIV